MYVNNPEKYLSEFDAELVSVDIKDDSDYFDFVAISNSSLSLIEPEQGGHPELLAMYMRGDLEMNEETDAMRFGSLIHSYMEDPTNFLVDDVDRPTDMNVKWADALYELIGAQTDVATIIHEAALLSDFHKSTKDMNKRMEKFSKECLAYYRLKCDAENYAHVITLQEKEKLNRIIANIDNNPTVKEVVDITTDNSRNLTVFKELPIVVRYKGEVLLKGKIDKMIIETNPERKTMKVKVIDWKTTSKGTGRFKDSIRKYRYYRQAGMYTFLVKVFLKHFFKDYHINSDDITFNFIAISTTAPYNCKPFSLNWKWLSEGQKEVGINVDRYVNAVTTTNTFRSDYVVEHIPWIPDYETIARDTTKELPV